MPEAGGTDSGALVRLDHVSSLHSPAAAHDPRL